MAAYELCELALLFHLPEQHAFTDYIVKVIAELLFDKTSCTPHWTSVLLKYLKFENPTNVMGKYKEIHIWEFPPSRTFIGLNPILRRLLFKEAIKKCGSEHSLSYKINKSASKYGLRRFYSRRSVYSWIKGEKWDRGRKKAINIPLWVLIEISKIEGKHSLKEIEKNVVYYTSRGDANSIDKPKLPILLTPELVSVIFNFCGDGHIGKLGKTSSYKQMNKEGLNNLLNRLNNIFGKFKYSNREFDNGRLNIPKVISDFYVYYFNLKDTSTFSARIPYKIKRMQKEFLIAGLCAFIVDEGNVAEVIEIYSKNYKLLRDIREIAIKCHYKCNPIREKFARNKLDCYRFNISSESYLKLNRDIERLGKKFPKCSLAHKMSKLNVLVKRKIKGKAIIKNGLTKNKITRLLNKRERTISELSEILNLAPSTIREHLWALRKAVIIKSKKRKRDILWSLSKFV